MIADLDTLLTALHVELTDRIIPPLGIGRSGPGKPPEVTDAELVCLAGISDHSCPSPSFRDKLILGVFPQAGWGA